jgi:hypothetical protein
LIPQFVLKIGNIAQVGVHITHDPNNRPGHFIALFTILGFQDLIDHQLNVPAILRYDQLGSFSIVL